jgi:beta-lactam-binding protein with PASTA domain
VKRILHSQDLPYGTEILKKAEIAHQANHEMNVPDFTGMTLDSIFKTCYEKQLCLAIAGKGEQVTEQSIKPGRRVPYGTRIRIQMGDSLQPKRVRMPHVVGLPLREAVSRLHYRGINIKIDGTGVVRDQQPSGGKWIKGKGTCTIVAG